MKFSEIKKTIEGIREHPFLKRIEAWARTHSFPGFFGVPIYDVIVFLRKEIRRDSLTTRSNSIAFSFFLSIFPAMLALFTLIPYVLPLFLSEKIVSLLPQDAQIVFNLDGEIDANQTLLAYIAQILPNFNGKTEAVLFIQEWATQPRAGLLSVSFVLALFFASNGIMTLMRGFEKSYRMTYKKRNAFRKRLIAIYLTFWVGLLLLISFFYLLFGATVFSKLFTVLHIESFSTVGLSILSFAGLVFLLYSGISIIFRRGAATIRRFSFFSAGATLATLLSLIATGLFSFFVNEFGSYNKLYDSIGTLLVIMLWVQINTFSLLVGYELNASIAVNRDLKKMKTPEI